MTIKNIVHVLLIILCINKNECSEKKYYNYTLFRGIPVNTVHLRFFQNLTAAYDVNYWRGPGDYLYRPVEFMVRPDQKKEFLRAAENNGVYLTTIMEDVQRALDLQTVKSYIRRDMESFNWQSFYRLNDIYNWLNDLSHMNRKVMKVESIGKSHQGRDIMGVRIALIGSKLRSKVIVEGGIHAREWISPCFVTFLIHQILHAPESHNLALKTIAQTYEWYFVPVLNPDGYEYTHIKDRMWRKNSRAVDLNRNFDVAFGTIGVSHDINSETFCGTKAFSEPESTAMANFIRRHSKDLEYYLAFHSYGQYMIIPYTHLKRHQGNFDEVKKMADQAATEISRRFKTHYTVGTAYDTVGYLTSGVSGCWTKMKFNVPYVVTFELRDDGRHGFALPPAQILPTCQETMDGVLSLLTPRRTLTRPRDKGNGGVETLLDVFVLMWNVVLFIIVRF